MHANNPANPMKNESGYQISFATDITKQTIRELKMIKWNLLLFREKVLKKYMYIKSRELGGVF